MGTTKTPEEQLTSLNYELTEHTPFSPPMAIGEIVGNLLYLSGATPPVREGKQWSSRVGDLNTVKEAS